MKNNMTITDAWCACLEIYLVQGKQGLEDSLDQYVSDPALKSKIKADVIRTAIAIQG